MASNPLLAPPFFVIPGINPDDPISAQMEQIDQLNTILLQDIDHNFARFHQVVTTKLLPEIKRFAMASEPTREASKFWRSFFEAAAAVKVPVSGIDSTLSPTPSRTAPHQHAYDDDLDHETSLSSDDRSFLFGVDAVGSTPRGVRTQRVSDAGSWASGDGGGEDSTFDRLDRKLRDDLKIDQEGEGGDGGVGTPSLPSGYDYGRAGGEGEYEEEPSVMLSKEERAAYGSLVDSPDGPRIRNAATPKPGKSSRSPHATRTHPHPSQNPFVRSGATPTARTAPGGWDGIADLRKTPLNPRIKKISAGPGPSSQRRGGDLTGMSFLSDDSEDEELDRQLEALSPPVTMNFTLPPRNISKTPAKEAARLVLGDLMREMGVESPGMDTPEAFKRYGGGGDVSADGGGSGGAGSGGGGGGGGGRNLFAAQSDNQDHSSQYNQISLAGVVDDEDEIGIPPRHELNDLTFDDDTYEAPVTQTTDTFEQSMLRRQQAAAEHGEGEGDVSGDLIGLSPASEAGRVFGGAGAFGGRGGGFNLMGPDEMQTFHGGRLEDAGTSVIESPSYGLGKSMRRKEDR